MPVFPLLQLDPSIVRTMVNMSSLLGNEALPEVSDQQIETVFKYFLGQGTVKGLCANALFFLHMSGARSDSLLDMKWTQLLRGFHSLNNLQRSHPSDIRALVLHDRCSRDGWQQYFYLSPHTNHYLNPIVAVAFYVVGKWTLTDEEGLNMSTLGNWCEVPFAFGDRQTYFRYIREAFEFCGIDRQYTRSVGRVVHTTRCKGADVSELAIQAAQNRISIDSAAVTAIKKLAMPAIIAQTGCSDNRPFHMPIFDDACKPPVFLVQQFCTWIHRSLDSPQDHHDGERDTKLSRKMLDVLMELIEVFLRVSADLQDEWPNHPLYQLPVFTQPGDLRKMWIEYKMFCKAYCSEAGSCVFEGDFLLR